MKKIIQFSVISMFIIIFFSCSKDENRIINSNNSLKNEGLFKKEIIAYDKSKLNSVFLKIYSNDKSILDDFLKNNKIILVTNKDFITRQKDSIQPVKITSIISEKYNLDNEPQINIELITSNLKSDISTFSLYIKKNNNYKDFVIGYPIGYITSNNFIGAVHLGWGYEFIVKYRYKSHWYSSWKELTVNGANSWWIYPTMPYYTRLDETWDLYKREIIIYPCYYQNSTNYRIAYTRNDFRGHDCTIGSYDGANCYVGTPPDGATAFIYANNFYYTPINGNQCPMSGSWFDGVNCFVMNIPTECDPFIWNNKWYVKTDIINYK